MKKTWKNKITKKELKHIRETTDTGTLQQFKSNRAWHKKQDKEPCWDCRLIARKLGLEK